MPISPRAKNQSGFTLFELLIVMTIVSMMTGMTGMAMRSNIPSIALNQQQASLTGALKRARATAQIDQRRVEVVVFEDRAVVDGTVYRTRHGILFETENLIRFYPDGYTEGGTIIFSRSDFQRRIRIQPFTGRIRAG